MKSIIKTTAIALSLAAALAATARAEIGVDAKTVKICAAVPLSGPNALIGESMKAGVLSYMDQMSAAGGVNGRKVQVIFNDDQYTPDITKKVVSACMPDSFTLGFFFGSATSVAVRPLFSKAGVPFFGMLSGSVALRRGPGGQAEGDELIYAVRASYQDEAHKIAERLLNEKQGMRIGIAAQDDAFGKVVTDLVSKELSMAGNKVLVVAKIPRNSNDASAAVTELKKANVEAVVLATLYGPSAAVVKGYADVKHGKPIFKATSPVGTNLLENELGKLAAGVEISQVVPNPSEKSIPVVKEFLSAQSKYLVGKDVKPDAFIALESFISAKIMVAALQDAGKDLTRAGFQAALNNMQVRDFSGYWATFDGTREGSHEVNIVMLNGKNNGKYID